MGTWTLKHKESRNNGRRFLRFFELTDKAIRADVKERTQDLPIFVTQVVTRLMKGNIMYADSYKRRDTIKDIEEELYDTAAYAYLLWHKIQNLRTKVDALRHERLRTGENY